MSASGGTYTYSTTVSRPGIITVITRKYTQNQIYTEYYANQVFSGANAWTTTSSQINFNWWLGAVFGSYYDHVSVKFFFLLKAPVSGTYTFKVTSDDRTRFYLNGALVIDQPCCGTKTGTKTLSAGTYYEGYVDYDENTSPAYTYLYWSYPGQGEVIIPSWAYYAPSYKSLNDITINCPAGYTKQTSGGRPVCNTVCGDGKRAGTEACDDNDTSGGDGCSASCTVETGYSCTGGSTSSADTCSTICGDGRRVGSEACDDDDTSGGDGCSASCTVETGWSCTGGNVSTKDTCNEI